MSEAVKNENIASALVGIQFKDGGRTPAEGFDCWGLVVFFYHLNGVTLEDYLIGAYESQKIDGMIENEAQRWLRVRQGDESRMDVMAFRIDNDHPSWVTHVGVYVGCGRFMHCLQKTGVIISRLDDIYWRTRLAGIYRRLA